MIEEIPLYELLKIKTVALLGINADAVHIYFGLGLYLSVVAFFRNNGRKNGLRAWMLLPTFLLSVLVEVGDYHYAMASAGFFEIQKSLIDIVNTNLLPVLFFLLWRWDFFPKSSPDPRPASD